MDSGTWAVEARVKVSAGNERNPIFNHGNSADYFEIYVDGNFAIHVLWVTAGVTVLEVATANNVLANNVTSFVSVSEAYDGKIFIHVGPDGGMTTCVKNEVHPGVYPPAQAGYAFVGYSMAAPVFFFKGTVGCVRVSDIPLDAGLILFRYPLSPMSRVGRPTSIYGAQGCPRP